MRVFLPLCAAAYLALLSHSGRASSYDFTPRSPVDPEIAARQQQFDLLEKAAQELLKAKKYGPAVVTYQQALTFSSDKDDWDATCLQEMAEALTADGQPDKAMDAYRRLYSPPHGESGSFLSDAGTIMQYALLLSQAGRQDEAMSVFDHAAQCRDYEDGKQSVAIRLPRFGPGHTPYDANLLQASAHACISSSKWGFDNVEALAHMRQAVFLAPDSPLVQFYMGECLGWAGGPNNAETNAKAKAAYKKAAELDTAQEITHYYQNQAKEYQKSRKDDEGGIAGCYADALKFANPATRVELEAEIAKLPAYTAHLALSP